MISLFRFRPKPADQDIECEDEVRRTPLLGHSYILCIFLNAHDPIFTGEGQLIGVADTGIDWDNCLFWDSAGSSAFPDRGQPPPLQADFTRRKLIAYTWYEDCSICNRCPFDIEEDRVSVVRVVPALQQS